jgi:tetratricopeptide (TPR) repeat protein
MRVRFQLLLVCAVVLVAYYPSGFAELCPIDDMELVNRLRGTTLADFTSQLLPSSLLYYRPMIGLSYFLDKYLLGFDPGFMHLHNVLLHCANAILVFLLTRKLLAPQERPGSHLPLAAALLFALHPICSESVNWISGRTDVLALFFILLSTLALLNYRESRSRKDFLCAGAAFLLGFLTKETSLAFAPGFLLIWSARPDAAQRPPGPQRTLFRRCLPPLILCAFAVASYFVLRHLAYFARPGKFCLTLRFIFTDWTHSCLVCLRAFGFYLKKLVIPYPLNFAINDLDPLYELLGIPLVVICVYIACRRTVVSAFFSAGMLLITPALVLAFNQVAWTPYAERYIYLTSAFVVIAVLLYLRRNLVLPDAWVGTAFMAILLTAMGIASFNRSLIWSSNFLLCQDTVQKSPLSRDMRVLYGSLFAERGDYQNALIQTKAANAIPGLGYDERADINLSCMVRDSGDIDQAIAICQSSLEKSKGTSAKALENLASLGEIKRKRAGVAARPAIDRKLFAYYLKLFKLDHDPCNLYHLGYVSRNLGENDRALKYYQHACYNLSKDNDCRKLAEAALRSMTRNPIQGARPGVTVEKTELSGL